MQRQVAQNGWEKQVRFWGALREADLAERYRAAHLLTVPSSYEGFGIVYLEAMSFGVPPLATTAGAAHEIITHGRDGYLIRPNDTDQFAQILRQFYADKPRQLAMSQAARQRFERHPTWAESGARVAEFVQAMGGGE
jgi:glycosyltransferase involved in cell wall biosynthesis